MDSRGGLISEQGVEVIEGGSPVQTISGKKDDFLELEQETGKTLYELFAAHYLSHHMVNTTDKGYARFCQTAPMHHEMCKAYRTKNRCVLVAPAKFAKSTWTSFIQPLTDVCLGLISGDELLISNTGRIAEQWLEMIKNEIDNNVDIRHDFGNLRGSVWRQDKVKFTTGTMMASLGMNYQIRSTGWGKVIADDIENDEMVRSEDQRQKFSDWWDGAMMGRMHPHTRVVVIGNFIHPLCKIKKMFDNVNGQYDAWTRIKFAALDESGESTWPARWPTKVILEQRREMGERHFLTEKMNAPVFGADHIFRPEWLKYYKPEDLPNDLFIVTSLDASSGKSQEVGDYSALTVWGKDFENDNYYLLACERGRWATYDKVKAMFTYDQTYNPTFNLIEWDAYGNELKNVIAKEAEQRRVHFPCRPVTPDKNKERRAMATTPLWQKGKVFLPKGGAQRLVDELLMFPMGDHDDYVDSTAHALTFLRRQRPRARHRKTIDRPFNRRKPNPAGRLV